jgi:Tfp pilus assembly protein PilF
MHGRYLSQISNLMSDVHGARRMSCGTYFRKAALPVLLCTCIGLAGCSDAVPPSQVSSPSALTAIKLERNARIIEFKNTLQKDAYAADARLGLGTLLIEQADLLGGERELRNALEFGIDPNLVLPSLARVWNNLGRSKELIETYANTQLSNPAASAELRAALATAYANQGDSAKARTLVEAALKDNPQSPQARVLQAKIALADQRIDEAMRIIDAILMEHPKFSEAWGLKADILLLVKGDSAGATAAYETALTIEPWNLPIHAKLMTMAIDAKDQDTAQARLSRLAAIAPQSLLHRYFTARLALAKGDVNAAQDRVPEGSSRIAAFC